MTDSDSESGPSSPILSALDSSSALILVHDDDDDDDDRLPLSHPTDDDDDDEEDSPFLGITRPYVQPLSPSTVFLYLLSPYLKLGALLLPSAAVQFPLKLTLPALLLFAVLAAFTRQIWYMLARYLRKGDLEDVLVEAFTSSSRRRRLGERTRHLIRSLVRLSTGTFRVVLLSTYLRQAARVLLPCLPKGTPSIPIWAFTVLLGGILYPFVIAQSFASRRVVYATWGSVLTYLLWFACVAYAHSQASLAVNQSWLRMGLLWQGITTIAFTFTSSSTLTLYASLKASTHPHSTASSFSKHPLSRSFKTLSLLSVSLAVCLTFPLLIYAAFPNYPPAAQHDSIPTPTPTPSHRILPFISTLSALTLLLGIPSLLITTPALPIPERIRHTTTIPVSRTLLWVVVVLLSVVQTGVSDPAIQAIQQGGAGAGVGASRSAVTRELEWNLTSVYSDVVMVCALVGTYFLPALVHITTHFFKRPLSIVMPALPATPNPFSRSRVRSHPSSSSTSTSTSNTDTDADADTGGFSASFPPSSTLYPFGSDVPPIPEESSAYNPPPAHNPALAHNLPPAHNPALAHNLPPVHNPPPTSAPAPAHDPSPDPHDPSSPDPLNPSPDPHDPPSSANDPLLQRKELALQRTQFRRRIVWDVGVWVLLLPVGGGGFVWAVGRGGGWF